MVANTPHGILQDNVSALQERPRAPAYSPAKNLTDQEDLNRRSEKRNENQREQREQRRNHNLAVAELVSEVPVEESANDRADLRAISETCLPGSRERVLSSRSIVLAVFLDECWLSEEGVDQDDIVSFHDDRAGYGDGPEASLRILLQGLHQSQVVFFIGRSSGQSMVNLSLAGKGPGSVLDVNHVVLLVCHGVSVYRRLV